MTNERKRPTKKQYELLRYIEQFVLEKGYGPSYREIMIGLNYTSVATVAAHVNNLVAGGHLNKKGRSARSLEVVDQPKAGGKVRTNRINPDEEKWLVEQVDYRFTLAENGQPTKDEIDGLYVLVGALKVLGLVGAANSFIPRLSEIKNKV